MVSIWATRRLNGVPRIQNEAVLAAAIGARSLIAKPQVEERVWSVCRFLTFLGRGRSFETPKIYLPWASGYA
jgi:hypothetical protein